MREFSAKFILKQLNIAIELAGKDDFLPVGAVLVDREGRIHLSRGNYPVHCEQSFPLQSYFGGTIFVSLEPCPSCTFFLSQKKVKYIFFAAHNRKYGGCGGKIHLLNQLDSIFKPKIYGGLLSKKSQLIIQNFFKKNLRCSCHSTPNREK
jgi:tRNA(Arg) A34 adenosine deaminase TadA